MDAQYQALVNQIPARCSYNHAACTTINNALRRYHQLGRQVDSVFIARMHNFMRSGWYHCYRRTHSHLDQLVHIFTYHNPTQAELTYILDYYTSQSAAQIFIRLANDDKTRPSVAHFKKLISRCGPNTGLLNKTLMKYPKEERIQLASTCIQYKHWKLFEFIVDNTEYPIDDQTLGQYLVNMKADATAEFIKKHNLIPGPACLDAACVSGMVAEIEFVMNYRVVPTQVAVRGLIDNAPRSTQHIMKRTRRNRYGYYGRGNKINQIQFNNLFDRIVAEGYKVTLGDVDYALSQMVHIERLNQYGFPFDQTLLKLCHRYDFFPYEIKANIDLGCLREICGKGQNLTEIKKAISGSLVKPDTECLANASKYGRNLAVVRYLLNEHKVVPDKKIIKSCINGLKQTETLVLLWDKYSDAVTKKISDLEKKVVKLGGSLDDDASEKKTHDKSKTKSTGKKKVDKKVDPILGPVSDDEDTDVEETLVPSTRSGGRKKRSTVSDVIKKTGKKKVAMKDLTTGANAKSPATSDQETKKPATKPKPNTLVLDVVPMNARLMKKQLPLTKDAASLFKVKSGNFVDIRRLVLQMINKGKMINKTNKNVIIINPTLGELIGVQSKTKINIDQLDKIVTKLMVLPEEDIVIDI